MNILVIEDEERVADFLVRGLKGEGLVVTHAQDGETGLDYLKSDSFDIVILDLMLPGIDGREVCRKLRARKNYTPILMLTALDEPEEKIDGLQKGADDYMTKPFDFDELLARISALVRRDSLYSDRSDTSDSNVIDCGGIRYDKASFEVSYKDKVIELTEKEREILAVFLTNPDRVISRERLLNSIWGANADPLTNVIDVYIGRLRKKMNLDKDVIKNVRGVGYKFCP